LHHVFGFIVPSNDAADDAKDARIVTAHQELEELDFACADPRHYRFIDQSIGEGGGVLHKDLIGWVRHGLNPSLSR
jgi:hypothetical protein